MKTILHLFVSMALAAVAAGANGILVAFDNPSQRGSAGDALIFTGVVSNTGADTVFLNGDNLNLAGTSFTVTDQFFANVPVSLDGGQSTLSIELFDVSLSDPLTDPPGIYQGSYQLTGGVDGNAQDPLVQASFSVTLTPEPGAAFWCASVLGALFVRLRGSPNRHHTP